MTAYPLHAGCLCGAVRLVLHRPPQRVGLCHCMTCRKETGSPFKHFAVFRRTDVTVSGTTRSWASPNGAPRHFCGDCGGRVYAESSVPDELELNVGALDGTSLLPPGYEGYVPRREAWLPALGLVEYQQDRPGGGATTADTRSG